MHKRFRLLFPKQIESKDQHLGCATLMGNKESKFRTKVYLSGHIHLSKNLNPAYRMTATAKPVKTPISPVPAFAMGPVYQDCFMLGAIITNDPQKARNAAIPGGSRLALSQATML